MCRGGHMDRQEARGMQESGLFLCHSCLTGTSRCLKNYINLFWGLNKWCLLSSGLELLDFRQRPHLSSPVIGGELSSFFLANQEGQVKEWVTVVNGSHSAGGGYLSSQPLIVLPSQYDCSKHQVISHEPLGIHTKQSQAAEDDFQILALGQG